MLRYAAKALLSRTLQAFLRKYLDDVELDGIHLPALLGDYASSSHTSSTPGGRGSGEASSPSGGWGVRLANVKLREGVELTKLPGKRRRRRRNPDGSGGDVSKRLRRRGSQTAMKATAWEESAEDRDVGTSPSSVGSRVAAPWDPLRMEEQGADGDRVTATATAQAGLDNGTTPPEGSQAIDTSTATFVGNNGDGNGDGDGDGDAPPSRFCLGVRRTSSGRMQSVSVVAPLQERGGVDAGKRGSEVEVSSGGGIEKEKVGARETTEWKVEPPDMIMDDSFLATPVSSARRSGAEGPVVFEEKIEEEREEVIVDDEDGQDVDESYIGGEARADDVVQEENFVVRVGKGGRIGTLHIRLVAGDLHITIEDADLVLEALPQEANGGRGKSDAESNNSAAGNSSTPNSKNEASKSSGLDLDDGKGSKDGQHTGGDGELTSDGEETIGDKIMKKSGIARALAAIPHLFLRDCRVRLVVKEDTQSAESPEKSKSPTNRDGRSSADVRSTNTVVVLGIGFLSVTSGEDFLAHLRPCDVASGHGGTTAFRQGQKMEKSESCPLPKTCARTSTGLSEASNEDETKCQRHEFLRKRIRTGKGPEGGIWLKIFPPGGKEKVCDRGDPKWARRLFMDSSDLFLFRCSGIDLHARILLGEKKSPVSEIQNGSIFGSEFDEYTMDSMLFGVDYVADRSYLASDDEATSHDDLEDSSDVDINGIHSIPFRSCFHRVARGICRQSCGVGHLPSEDCPSCWEDGSGHCTEGQTCEHPMDSLMPLPGVVFFLSIVDPFEMNVDRKSLEVLGMLRSLFTSQKLPSRDHEDSAVGVKGQHITNTTPSCSPANSRRSGIDIQQKEKIDYGHDDDKCRKDATFATNIGDSFPSMMQPDVVQVTGIHLAKMTFRLHIMQEGAFHDNDHTFCFWAFSAHSVTLDSKEMTADQLPVKDISLDIGALQIHEMKGVCSSQLLSLGSNPSLQDETEPFARCHTVPDRLWPCTASAILNVPPPLETLAFEPRMKHAIQLRMLQYPRRTNQQNASYDNASPVVSNLGFVDMKLGVIDMDMCSSRLGQVSAAKNEALKVLHGRNNGVNVPETRAPRDREDVSDSKPSRQVSWRYKVRLDGGKIVYEPRVRFAFPSCEFFGGKSSTLGFSVDTFLNDFRVSYGKQEVRQKPVRSPTSLASLPDSARMCILLFLDDLRPLEKALKLKRKSNSFLRCHAINKKLTRLASAKKPSTVIPTLSAPKKVTALQSEENRRRNLVAHLSKLDTNSLEELLSLHRRKQNGQGG